MTSLPASEHNEESPALLAEYLAQNGLPPRVSLPADVFARLTLEEQQATIEACKALAAGDENAGARLNELWEEIWDRLEMPAFEAALSEAKEKGTIPWETVKKELGLTD